MTQFFLDLNSLVFDPVRGRDRVAVAMLFGAGLAGFARSAEGVGTCLSIAMLLWVGRRTD